MPKSSNFVLSTDREVQAAKSKGKRAEFRIKGARNLVLRITPGGSKSWAFLYASPTSGQRRKLSIGTYPAMDLARAKKESLRLTLAVQDHKDPLLERHAEQAVDTFEKLARRYMIEHARKNARGAKRSQWTDSAQRILNTDILPVLGRHRASAITRQQVMEAVETVADRGAYVMADHVLGLIRAIYNWSIGTGRLEVNPTLGLKKRNVARPRNRVLSVDEIRSFWQALESRPKLSAEIRDALKLQLLLGIRISEVLGAAMSEIDLHGGTWIIPDTRTKSRREHRLPLPPWAASIFKSAIERAGENTWIFPSPLGDGPIRPRSATRAVARLRDQIGLADVGTHDLRRTLATGLGNMGVSDEVIERVLNHAPRTVTGRHYNHAKHFEPMRRALEAWADRIHDILHGQQRDPKVVKILRGTGT